MMVGHFHSVRASPRLRGTQHGCRESALSKEMSSPKDARARVHNTPSAVARTDNIVSSYLNLPLRVPLPTSSGSCHLIPP